MDLANKYRPLTLDAVVGQSAAIKQIKAILAKPVADMPEVIHIVGPSGYGKTTLARIIAGSLIGVPANTVDGNSNYREVNLANNRGIDDARQLAEQSKFKPSAGKYRVFLLDEIQGLTAVAAPAILKPMEDAPPTTKFITCTNQPAKVLPTIRRRGVTVNLATPTPDDIMALIKRVAKAEKVKLRSKVMAAIVSNSLLQPAMALNLLSAAMDVLSQKGSSREQLSAIKAAKDTDIDVLIHRFVTACYTGKIIKTMDMLRGNQLDIVSFCTRALDINAQLHYCINDETAKPDSELMAAVVDAVKAHINDKKVSFGAKMWLHTNLTTLRFQALNNQLISDNHDLLAILLRAGG